MKEKLLKLKEFRKMHLKFGADYAEKLTEFRDTNKKLLESIENAGQTVEELETSIRDETIDIYNKTGEKKQEFGLGIRVLTKLEYSQITAFEWAKEHDMALALNKKVFEKLAKTTDIKFVVKTEVPSATIPTKIEVE